MKKSKRRSTVMLILIFVVIGIILLTVGPMIINYIFIAELHLNSNLAFDAGNLLDYYGAVLGGLVTCFAIVAAIHTNNINLEQERQRAQFERAYEVYHKLPEILARLESSAIHLQYSVNISEAALVETLDTMKECEAALREQHFVNEKYFNKDVDDLLTEIVGASTNCQDIAESFLREKEKAGESFEPPHDELESAFSKLRSTIESAKNEIMAEINKFVFGDN